MYRFRLTSESCVNDESQTFIMFIMCCKPGLLIHNEIYVTQFGYSKTGVYYVWIIIEYTFYRIKRALLALMAD